jgi:D-alanyl-D-alanine carboxypeptidase
VSETAASRPPSKLGVEACSTISVDMAARAMAVRSANDVAVVVAENIAGSEEAFAEAMTRKARSLGMSRTSFVNASGLPDERQVSTARDMAILGKALSDRFPRWFRYFSTETVSYNGRSWRNTNRLLTKVEGMDGIKTGYIRASGFNLCASVRRDGKHVIACVIGGKSGAARNRRMRELIEAHLPKASGGGLLGFL